MNAGGFIGPFGSDACRVKSEGSRNRTVQRGFHTEWVSVYVNDKFSCISPIGSKLIE